MAQKTYTVSELNRETSFLLSSHFLSILVEGEISNLSIPASGHCYFSLKDANAQVRCAMFRSQQRRSFRPENGKHVIVKAQVSLYEPRGDFQLIIEYMEEAGAGALRRAFDALTQKLAAEGLFSEVHKKPLPALPKAVGVITSATGAAIRDILTVLKRRFPAVPVIIYPVAVQGENAKYEICRALALAGNLNQCDVIILARGGGSIEDLWAFNEEIVARAIFACRIPVISGIGHETDVTIADFVADLRAATPSAAAESATPDYTQWLNYFTQIETRLGLLLQRILMQNAQKIDWLNGRLQQQHPAQRLTRNRQRLQELELRLGKTMKTRLTHDLKIVEIKTARLWQHSPASVIRRSQEKHKYLNERLINSIQYRLKQHKQQILAISQTLNAVSPLATLNRGYALVSEAATGKIIRSAGQVKVGDGLTIRLAKGTLKSTVDEIPDDKPKQQV